MSLKSFKRLSKDHKEIYLNRARRLVYPDLRSKYDEDHKIVKATAKFLYKLDQLKAAGGGGNIFGSDNHKQAFHDQANRW
jgi:hypothetical protein